MDKSIKQIADELGVDKQRVYRYIKRKHIREAHQMNSVLYYDELAQTLIKQGLLDDCVSNKAHQERDTDTRDALLDLLRGELEIKNEQIRQLNEQIHELHARLAEQTAAQLATQKLLQGSQALHAGTMQSLPTPTPAKVQPVPPPASAPNSSRPPVRRHPPVPKKPRFFDYLDGLLGGK